MPVMQWWRVYTIKEDLIRVFSTSNSSDSVDMIGEENSAFKHEEAYCNIISYVQFLIHEQKKCIHVIVEDTDIFVLLVNIRWKWQAGVHITVKNCCDQVIDINATIAKLGHKCSHAAISSSRYSWLWHCKLHVWKRKGFKSNNHPKTWQ